MSLRGLFLQLNLNFINLNYTRRLKENGGGGERTPTIQRRWINQQEKRGLFLKSDFNTYIHLWYMLDMLAKPYVPTPND